MTALRKCILIGESFLSTSSSSDWSLLQKHLILARSKSNFYTSAQTILSHIQDISTPFPFRIANPKGILLDNIKLTCHMFFQCFFIRHRPLFNHSKISCSKPNANQNVIYASITNNISAWKTELQTQTISLSSRLLKRQLCQHQSNSSTLIDLTNIPNNDNSTYDCTQYQATTAQTITCRKPKRLKSQSSQTTHQSNPIRPSTSQTSPSSSMSALLFQTILREEELLSDNTMASAVSFLRTLANRNTFIASNYITELIRQNGGTNWARIGRLFRNNIALNRGDGLYILPAYSGSSKKGHWIVILIQIQNGIAIGFSLDSLGTSYGSDQSEKSKIRKKIMLGFRIPNLQHWRDIPILLQTELECGPRCIWNMTLICLARNNHIGLDSIFQKLSNLGGIPRNISARQIRNDVYQILITKSGNDLFHRVFNLST